MKRGSFSSEKGEEVRPETRQPRDSKKERGMHALGEILMPCQNMQ
jgi:hypothetical protein